jgi:hypothetical protein
MLDQNALRGHRRARRVPVSLAFPSVRAPARHDGRRLHECGIQDGEALLWAGAPLIGIGDPLNLEAVTDRLSTEKDAAVRIDRWGGTALQVTRVDPAGFLKVSALGIEEQRVRVTRDARRVKPLQLGAWPASSSQIYARPAWVALAFEKTALWMTIASN